MKTEIEYELYCADSWVAGSNNLEEILRYAQEYREEGKVEVRKVIKKSEMIFLGSKLKKASESKTYKPKIVDMVLRTDSQGNVLPQKEIKESE